MNSVFMTLSFNNKIDSSSFSSDDFSLMDTVEVKLDNDVYVGFFVYCMYKHWKENNKYNIEVAEIIIKGNKFKTLKNTKGLNISLTRLVLIEKKIIYLELKH